MAVVLLLFDFLYDPDMTGWLFIKLLSWFVEGGEGRHSGELFCLLHTKIMRHMLGKITNWFD